MKFDMLFTICPQEQLQNVIDAAKKAGATGSTIISVRGAGVHEAKTFLGLTLDRPQEAFIALVDSNMTDNIIKAIYDAGDMVHPGNGISFALPVSKVVGLESQLCVIAKRQEDEAK